MNQRLFLKKHNNKIEWGFLTILIAIIIVLGFFYGASNTYNAYNKNITNSSDIQNSSENFVYDNFWHKFNTYSVIMINIKDNTHLVSQNELYKFQSKFFNDFGLSDSDQIIERNGVPVNPETLFCYMKFYEPSKKNILLIRKNCENKGD